jgi:alginate O-acetyltransferase complex protein AlgI
MLFNSVDFALFLPVVFLIYWSLKKKQSRNLFIVLSSYLFYGYWDWRFLILIIFSTIIDFTIGQALEAKSLGSRRRILLWISIIVNFGLLGFFKYFNFFIDNFNTAFTFFGTHTNLSTLKIILPVGISFYTFQTLSYTIDIYNKKLNATKDLIAFSAFVSFFPQLVAGPIERATNLLPQFYKKQSFNYLNSINGLKQILWGLFKKIVIADSCAEYVNLMYETSNDQSGSSLLLGAFFFSLQIYGDFSGYSDIAIGSSKLFGFKLSQNFAFPYFSRNVAEFWRRWHISLSTWFRDYLYIPLGGSKGSLQSKIRNTFIIFLVSGFWHGSNWTFIFWGGLHALLFLPLLITNNNRTKIEIVAKGNFLPSFKELLSISLTFTLITITWIFFRADNLNLAFQYINNIATYSLFTLPLNPNINLLITISVFTIIEWIGREQQFAIENLFLKNTILRWCFYLSICISILFFTTGEEQNFIYFQF